MNVNGKSKTPVINHLKLELSTNKVSLIPDDSGEFKAENNCSFTATITNLSNKFASFEIELFARSKGNDITSEGTWYKVESEICAKIQPTAQAEFEIKIIKAPISVYNTNFELIVKAFSGEYDSIFAQKSITLEVKQPEKSLKVDLPFKDFKVLPGDSVDIPVIVYNLSSRFKKITVTLEELNPDWFEGNTRKQVYLDAGNLTEVVFKCSKIPKLPESLNKTYDFIIRIYDQEQDSNSDVGGKLEILPYGEVKFSCDEKEKSIPKLGIVRLNYADYPLKFVNASNKLQIITIKLSEEKKHQFEHEFESGFELQPNGKEDEPIKKLLKITSYRHLFKLQNLIFKITPVLLNVHDKEINKAIQVYPNTEILKLKVKPIIPLWFQCGFGILSLLLLGLLFIPKAKHDAPVYSVRLIGNGATVISGSSDKTIRRWQINNCYWVVGCLLQNQGEITEKRGKESNTLKPIRVIRALPERDGQVAAGLENGDIQLWQISPPQNIETLSLEDKDLNLPNKIKPNDRVFDIDFTEDSNYMFSGHGSGNVIQWDLNNQNQKSKYFKHVQNFSTAISAIRVINIPNKSPLIAIQRNKEKIQQLQNLLASEEFKQIPSKRLDETLKRTQEYLAKKQTQKPSLVAIVGQYNKFFLWDWQYRTSYEINYTYDKYLSKNKPNNIEIPLVYGRGNYITSIDAVKNHNSQSLVTADDKGFITLWDTEKLSVCIKDKEVESTKIKRAKGNKEDSGKNIIPIRTDTENKNYPISCPDGILYQQQHGLYSQVPVRSVSITNDIINDITNDGKYLASAGDDGRVALWEIKDRKISFLADVVSFHDEKIRSVDIKLTKDNEILVAIAAPNNEVKVYKVNPGDSHDCQ
jgi:WD40 repeat protein